MAAPHPPPEADREFLNYPDFQHSISDQASPLYETVENWFYFNYSEE
jgi:hypothetical protein